MYMSYLVQPILWDHTYWRGMISSLAGYQACLAELEDHVRTG